MDKKTVGNKKQSNIMGTTNGNKDTIEYVIESPIRCGFLLRFCDSQYNSENLNFVMDVDNFRDLLKVDAACWKKSWVELDLELKLKDSESLKLENETWPSLIISKQSVEIYMNNLLETYITEDAEKEICTADYIRDNTLRRAHYLTIYGPEVFMEAIIDPIKTLRRDIYPRFLAADLYVTMLSRIDSCMSLPPASALDVPPPTSSLIEFASIEEFEVERLYTLAEILSCRYLYADFLGFLAHRVCSENLLCVRMVDVFKEKILQDTEESLAAAENDAWDIYKFFVASGSAFEVSFSYASRKQLMRSLARPTLTTFDEIRKSSYEMLAANFELYKTRERYTQLGSMLRSKKVELERERAKSRPKSLTTSLSCFGL